MSGKLFPDEWLHRFGHDRVAVLERYGETWRVIVGLSTVAANVSHAEASAIAEGIIGTYRHGGDDGR